MSEEREIAQEIGRDLLVHPLAQRVASSWKATGDNTIHTAADVLGERLLRLGGLLLIAAESPAHLAINVADADKCSAMLRVAQLASKATPYLWTEHVRSALNGGRNPDDETAGVAPRLPRHTISPRLLPEPRMWWTFETGITTADFKLHGYELAIDACLIADEEDGFSVYDIGELSDREHETPRPYIRRSHFQYGKVYPDDFQDDLVNLESALEFMAFLNSPYIPKAKVRLGRQERRGLIRASAPDVGDTVTFVDLRRPSTPGGSDEDSSTSIYWKHRWVVSGHYRAQWYPSEEAHHLIWIAPHLKGPKDAPLMEHAYRVRR